TTFGATAPIAGYKDASRFGQGTKGSTARFAYRDSRKSIIGGHLQASRQLQYTTAGKINGLCTPCHDPHGVSPTLGSNQAYALPLLKGTWLTSPYKEDFPAPDPTGAHVGSDANGNPRSWGRFINNYPPDNRPTPTQPYNNYNIDRTTFGGSTRISEDESRFAGLCLSCHNKGDLNKSQGQEFRTIDRVHNAVKGWGQNREHSYSCSKCHQAHSSGLPRLMQTNCLNSNHRGQRVSGGQPWSADNQWYNAHPQGDEHRGYPAGSVLGDSSANEGMTSCHTSAGNNPGIWPDKNLWNNVTPW
ncbi:MAG TPA: CxxxxCH/CxxCH domain-containing protein, partial [Geobacteraceae bacterium]|nr:CxxxxCH/CxxCH domain-containing protein [Geobacteraceae bacterium]